MMRVPIPLGVAVAIMLPIAFGAPSRLSSANATYSESFFPSYLVARDDSVDIGDHSDILRMAAIGDSYSAGIGAGGRLGSILDPTAWLCSRYDHSYPWLIHNDPALGDPNTRKFQFQSCSGALAHEVKDKQIPSIDSNQQVILLSAGGNDAGLTHILNSCVYQILSLTFGQAEIAKLKSYDPKFEWVKDFDWTSVGLSCDEQLDHSQTIIDSSDFSATLDSLLNAAKNKLSLTGGMIYYTGYAKFWAESLSSDCNSVSWTSWLNAIPAGFRPKEFLTVAHRARMNVLVDAVNTKLKAAVQRAGASVTFVDYDSYVGRYGGRFCESGVDESTVESGSRLRLMFYELNSLDPLGLDPWKRSEAVDGDGTFQGDLSEFAQLHLSLDPGSKLTYEGPVAASKAFQAQLAAVDLEVRNPLPDGYGRSFHPQVLLHEIIASKVIYHMSNNKALANAEPEIPEVFKFTSCPLTESPPKNLCFGTEGTTNPPSTFVHRILALGASIVWGQGSSTGNGFREELRNMIVAAGGSVNYVGSRQSGTMLDWDVEGTQGQVLSQVAVSAEKSLPYLPNVVLIHAGTNDMTIGIDVQNAHLRLGAIVDRILSAIPGCVVMVSTLIPNANPTGEANLQIYNAKMKEWVTMRKRQGALVHLVDMHDPSIVSLQDLVDGTHPNDGAFKRMAGAWYKGLQEVWSTCWIKPPGDNGLGDDVGGKPTTTCEKITANGQGPTLTQRGSPNAFDDGPYIHVGNPKETIWPQTVSSGVNNHGEHDAAGIYFADLDGDGLDDYIWVGDNTVIGVMFNYGIDTATDRMKWGTYTEYPQPGLCLRRGVRFSDIDADGRADFFCLGPDGLLQTWRNSGTASKVWPTWTNLGAIKPPAGYLQPNIRLADIDGDGRADFVALSINGDTVEAHAWRNAGQGIAPKSWDDLGVIMRVTIAATSTRAMRALRFIDLNGDGRDDFIVVDDAGKIWTWINHRGFEVGLAPVWVETGQTSTGADINVKNSSEVVHGKVRGTKRHDYIHVYAQVKGDFYPYIYLYANEGHGGRYQKGDGCRYCDMRGKGADDYVWIKSDGSLHVFGNRHEPPIWDLLGDLPIPIPPTTDIRKDIHLADIDGDGKCDYIYVDPVTNYFTVWINVWTESGGFVWGPPRVYSPKGQSGQAGALGVPCANHYTYYQFDLAVRFADIDGDGRADYLCLDYDGRVTGNLASGQGIPIVTSAKFLPAEFVSVGQVKFSEGADRSSIRFADINGDGRADYLWVLKGDGSVRAWTSNGMIPTAGSSFNWGGGGTVVSSGQIARGETINYGNIKGLGRADLIVVQPATAIANTYFNLCPGGSGPMPLLPALPGCTVC